MATKMTIGERMAALPGELQMLVYRFLPLQDFIPEMRNDLRVCVWCSVALNVRSTEFVTMVLLTMSDVVELEIEGHVFVCSSCIQERGGDAGCKAWLQQESAIYNSLERDEYSWAVCSEYGRRVRPPRILSFLQECGLLDGGCVFARKMDCSVGFEAARAHHPFSGGYELCAKCTEGGPPPRDRVPVVRSKARSVSLGRVVYYFGWSPQKWPAWLLVHFEDLMQGALTHFDFMRSGDGKRIKLTPCMLHWPEDKVPKALVRFVLDSLGATYEDPAVKQYLAGGGVSNKGFPN